MGRLKAATPVKLVTAICAMGLLTACGDDEVILAGERLSARAVSAYPNAIDLNAPIGAGEVDTTFAAPEVTRNDSWTHRAGGPTHYVPNPAVNAAPTLVWSADIGEGNTRKHRITSQPVIAGGVVYTLDSLSRISATSVNVSPRDLRNARKSAPSVIGCSARRCCIT